MSTATIQKVGSSLVQQQDLGVWEGDIAVLIPDLTTPTLRWKGAPLPWSMFRQALGFFRHAYNTWKSEAVLRLLYNQDTEEWAVICLPQTVRPGLEALELKVLTDAQAEQRAAAYAAYPGFSSCGTIHSHCMASAHQSGTDKAGEMKDPGVHITLGRISDKDVDCHGRVCFRGVQYAINWSEWLDGYKEEWGLTGANCTLTLGDDEDETILAFPAEWTACCYEPPPLPKWTPQAWSYGARTTKPWSPIYDNDGDYEDYSYSGGYGFQNSARDDDGNEEPRTRSCHAGEFGCEFLAEDIAEEIDSSVQAKEVTYASLISITEAVLNGFADEDLDTIILEDGSLDKNHPAYRQALDAAVAVSDLLKGINEVSYDHQLDPGLLLEILEGYTL